MNDTIAKHVLTSDTSLRRSPPEACSGWKSGVYLCIPMLRLIRRSLLGQLLGVYLLFVSPVRSTGLAVDTVVQDQLRAEVQSSDLALAQGIALETDDSLRDARDSLRDLAQLPGVQRSEQATMSLAFSAFKAARKDVDRVYWLDAEGVMRISVPSDIRTQDMELASTPIFQRARLANAPVVQAGLVDLTTFNAVVTIALPVWSESGIFEGVVATNLLLEDLSAPLITVVQEQRKLGYSLVISMVDDQGQLIASPERERLLQPVLDQMPGAREALAGTPAARMGTGPQGQEWLFTSTPVPTVGWAVVVQRPAKEAMAVVDNFIAWLSAAAFLFGLGGLLFWWVLVRRVIRPLHSLAGAHQAALTPLISPASLRVQPPSLSTRRDEIGELTRALTRLQHDVTMQLSELHTLLDTSTALVSTLDPHEVAEAIIREVSRLVDVQSAVVRVPDEHGYLRVLASVGRGPDYDHSAPVAPDDPLSPAARALRERRPVQMVAGEGSDYPAQSYDDGFRALLAIPIISPRVGGVALLVHRTRPEPFTSAEVDLLLTFANYATLAWEHAVLYERSDMRLHEVAMENERLYRRTAEEKQTLAAIMESMNDGLVLTSIDGALLYANAGAKALLGRSLHITESNHLEAVYSALRAQATDPLGYDLALEQVRARKLSTWMVETQRESGGCALLLRLFDVHDEGGQVIGRGLLLRDVTREQEIDRFKSSLLSAVSHEIRTPLAAIKGHASTLLQEDVEWPPADRRHFLQTISDEADRLAQLMSNLLDLSRHEAGLLPLDKEPMQVAELVEHVVAHLPLAASELVVELEPDLPPVQVDGPRIEVVLRNLLSNAHAYGGGTTRIMASSIGDEVVMQIADNGPGMESEELSRIFERFYRAPRALQRRSDGTGLGLAISKAFVEAHGGTIWAKSSLTGTTISFTLPCARTSGNGRVETTIPISVATLGKG